MSLNSICCTWEMLQLKPNTKVVETSEAICTEVCFHESLPPRNEEGSRYLAGVSKLFPEIDLTVTVEMSHSVGNERKRNLLRGQPSVCTTHELRGLILR